MPAKLIWTEAQDLQIKRLRASRAVGVAIAAALGITVWAAADRARRIGARLPPPDYVPPPEDPEREPLPAGHPRSWNALLDGGVLTGTPYPFPVFVR